jgi:hypothetical protein
MLQREAVSAAGTAPAPWIVLPRGPAQVTWCLFLLLVPIYVGSSGLPQPSDLLAVLLAPMAVAGWNGRLERRYAHILRPLLWFTVWVCLVNYGWAAVLGRWGTLKDFLIFPLFYVFNVTVLLSAFLLARRDRQRFLRLTVDAIFVSVVFQVVASFSFRAAIRGTLFFNSPNQLGYYALLAACLFAVTQRPLSLGRLRSSIGVTCCAYLALLSASRAALAGIAILLFLLVFANPKTIIVASLAAVGLLTLGGPVSKALDAAEQRATEGRHSKESFAEERGYDRLWQYPEYLAVGAGEGAWERFAAPGEQPRELHSSFSAVVFSYGVVGVTLFLVFLVRVFRGAPLRMSAMIVPTLAYTIAHNGLRFTMFWVLLAVFIVLQQATAQPPARAG